MAASGAESGILQRLLAPSGREIPAEVSRYFLGLSLNEADHRRIQLLSEKANEGELTSQEREDLTTYFIVSDFLTIVQSRGKS